MSLWYDLKKKSYATNGKESWIKSYCDRAIGLLSQKLSAHFSGAEGRHNAEDLDFDQTSTVKEAITQGFEECSRKNESLVASLETEKAERLAECQGIRTELQDEKAERLADGQEIRDELQNEIQAIEGITDSIRADITPVLLTNELKEATLNETDSSVLCFNATDSYSAEGLEISFKAPCSKSEISRIDLTLLDGDMELMSEVEEVEPTDPDTDIEIPDLDIPTEDIEEPEEPDIYPEKIESFTFKGGKDFKEGEYVTILFSGSTVEVKVVYQAGFYESRISENARDISILYRYDKINSDDIFDNYQNIRELEYRTEELEEFRNSIKTPALADNESISKVVFSAENGKLKATTTSKPEEISLDTIAYEDKTYKDIFVTNNLVDWGTFENELDGASIGYGAPEITDEVCQSGEHSLKCFGNTNNHIKCQKVLDIGTTIYFACNARVDRYVSGKFGIQTVVNNKIVEAYLTNATDGFEMVSNIRTMSSSNLIMYVGSWSSADLDGYIDDVVIIDLSMFSVMPTKEELDRLYDNYVRIVTGREAVTDEETYILGEKVEDIEFTDAECVAAFMQKVNEKAEELGMTNSAFVTPSGAGTENSVTSKDLVRLFVGATAYDDLMKVWGKPSKTIYTKNETPAQHDFTSAMYADMNTDQPVTNGVTKSPYYFMGGKTGSWQVADRVIYNFGAICKVKDKLVVGVVMDSGSQAGRYTAINKLFEIAEDIIETGTTEITSVISDSACCCVLPEYNPNMYQNHPFDFLFEQNADTQIIPASVTKVITSMVMLDYIKELDETIEFVSSDLIGGSGNVFKVGDIITYKDALYAMMLPSSNSAAQAVARCVGSKILEKNATL